MRFVAYLVWEVSDTFNGMMSVPNLIAIINDESGQVFDETNKYLHKKKRSYSLYKEAFNK